jgi:Holliday junction resolvase RusA-like endonuclease
MQASKVAAAEAKMFHDAHTALNNPPTERNPALGQSLNDPAHAGLNHSALTAMIRSLQDKVKEQAEELTKLKQQSGPYAAKAEADRWFDREMTKDKAASAKFELAVVKAKGKSDQQRHMEQKAAKWVRAMNRQEESSEDLDEAKRDADNLLKRYQKAAEAAGKAIDDSKKYAGLVKEAFATFKSFGPKMSPEQISGSVEAESADAQRTQAKDNYNKLLDESMHINEHNLHASIGEERKVSLEVVEALKAKFAAAQEHFNMKLRSAQAKFETKEAASAQCAQIRKELELNAISNKCAHYETWIKEIASSNTTIHYVETKARLKEETQKLETCEVAAQQCQKGIMVVPSNNTAPTPSESNDPQGRDLMMMDLGI